MKHLEQKLQDYYNSRSLSADQVERIIKSGDMVKSDGKLSPGWWFAAAAVVLLCLGLLSIQSNEAALQKRAAVEVAKNHSKDLAPEIFSTSFGEIQTALPRLDFPLEPTQPELLTGLTVLGGRYCSLQGELAAQVSLVDGEGRGCTLYITPLTEEMKKIQPGVRELPEGLKVSIWHDAHRLFALARPDK
ncbi:MAG: hypothetical protein ACFCU3_08990 [Verrucomicrobiales bacterium]